MAAASRRSRRSLGRTTRKELRVTDGDLLDQVVDVIVNAWNVAGISMFWRSSEQAIHGCVRSALDIARQRGYRSIAFPLMGAGTGGFSPERALDILQDEARQIDYDGEVTLVRFRRAA